MTGAMDCLCGPGWTSHCGSAVEQGLESAHQALVALALPATHQPIVVVVSDEGDGSAQDTL